MSERATMQSGEQPGALRRIAGGVGHVAGAVVQVAEGVVNFAVDHGLGQVSPAITASTSVETVKLDRRSLEARMTTADAMRGEHPTWI